MIRIASLIILAGFSFAVESPRGTMEVVARSRAQKSREEFSRRSFLTAYRVFSHSRCVNCHPTGDAPLQGDEGRPHFYRVQRGEDGSGLPAMRCGNCHQAENTPGLHSPPGAAHPPSDKARPGEPRWHLPGPAAPLVFQDKSASELARQLKDPKQNGGLTFEQLVEHVEHDTLVRWAWNPGDGRVKPPISHEEFVKAVKDWLENGAAIPK